MGEIEASVAPARSEKPITFRDRQGEGSHMSSSNEQATPYWKLSAGWWLALVLAGGLLGAAYLESIRDLIYVWGVREEYSFGYMIPFITGFLIWQRKDLLERIEFKSSWTGLVIVLFGLVLFVVGELSTLLLVVQYSMVVVLLGLALALLGWKAFRIVAIPIAFLFFMIPLPQFLLQEISSKLQLMSSQLGVAVIRLFDISVLLEGNVIDLGSYKLQVVEACSGLRYLFPLMALGFMVAYFFNAAFWKRAVIFLSTIPITVLMNSFRIGAIGVMVDRWGIAMAEGFLHDFEGWVIFMACLAVLLVEMWILVRIGRDRKPLRAAFGIDMPAGTPAGARRIARKLPYLYYPAFVIILAILVLARALPERKEIIPERESFASFPLKIKDWEGRSSTLETIYLDALKLDDYLLTDFSNGRATVNFYIAYYASQRKGESAHSPRTCIPGGGWKINSIARVRLADPRLAGLTVNRIEIQRDELKQLGYYWFQGRGRVITNEYLVKWFIFWDSLTRHRSDGALVRLLVNVPVDEDVADVEASLVDFLADVKPMLDHYIPAESAN